MSTLSWNCRGLGNPWTVQEVVDMVSKNKPDFVFLMETKVDRSHAERLRVKLGFDEVCVPGFEKWRMTGFYGFPQRWRREESWNLIKSLASKSDLPWVVIGHFNDLLFQREKQGGNPHPDRLLRGFGDTIQDCGLTQLPMIGYPYTWETGKGTVDWIEEHLDKVLATQGWRDRVVEASVLNMLTRKSDHSALFLGILNPRARGGGGGTRGFSFEMAWLHDEGCRSVVEKTWNEGRAMGLQDCTALCGNRLTKWGGDRFHKFGEQMMKLRKAQMYASYRKKKNILSTLKNDYGNWVEGEAMTGVILDYFRNIFCTNGTGDGDEFYEKVPLRVIQAHNDSLLRPFQLEEVKSALFSMFPDKAPGPDGINPGFYQHFWDVVGGDVSSYFVDFLNTRSFPANLNATDIVLIPKKNAPKMVTDLRPIALSNVVYRVMAKMITARMKPIMDHIISDS
ncbi:PREDICTED: uncharacterized protein LOC109156288 [Ipomoea nil]|uniref:uncharacterized protein LOC109156288 n=1 Tax=Ipomoea nil TaxID=35883 RepID=UPI0009014221|nr:PREDICTED: uncharacterized protein LOC109156288 [Ipomoea nil]